MFQRHPISILNPYFELIDSQSIHPPVHVYAFNSPQVPLRGALAPS